MPLVSRSRRHLQNADQPLSGASSSRGRPTTIRDMDKTWLLRLRCPHSGQNLRWMTDAERCALNQRIASSGAFTRLGTRVKEPLEEGLVTGDGGWAYAVISTIPQLVSGEAIAMTSS